MLFVLSAAVKFHAKPVTACAVRSTPRLAQKAKLLAAELKRLEAKELKKQLHVNDALAKQYEKHLGNFEGHTPIPACSLYDSSLFSGLDVVNLEEDDAEWANTHLRIYSGLYGLVRPFDEIQPLSLPVSLGTKLKNSKGSFLREYWRDSITKELEEALLRLPLPVMINCAAEEDANAYDFDQLPEGTSITSIDFKVFDKNRSAEAMGEFVRWALETRCQTVEELLEYRGYVEEDEPATFRVSPKGSDKDTIVFEEAKGDGADGGWSKRLAESGKSKRAFVKEVASGKNRYKRSEINKATIKDQKKSRGKYAVY